MCGLESGPPESDCAACTRRIRTMSRYDRVGDYIEILDTGFQNALSNL